MRAEEMTKKDEKKKRKGLTSQKRSEHGWKQAYTKRTAKRNRAKNLDQAQKQLQPYNRMQRIKRMQRKKKTRNKSTGKHNRKAFPSNQTLRLT
jgi:hypothetical protein